MVRLCGGSATSRGQGIVEFAIALPIFLLLVFGTIELGWLVFTNHTLSSATREGARYAMVNGERSGVLATSASVGDVVSERARLLAGPVSTSISFSPDAEPGSQVTVTTSYQYQPLVAAITGIGPVTLNSSSTVIVQY